MKLTANEIKHLQESRRCEACNHLMALHTTHCCYSCDVDGCPCVWDKVDDHLKDKIEPLVLVELK